MRSCMLCCLTLVMLQASGSKASLSILAFRFLFFSFQFLLRCRNIYLQFL